MLSESTTFLEANPEITEDYLLNNEYVLNYINSHIKIVDSF